jgi:hypothetical protein
MLQRQLCHLKGRKLDHCQVVSWGIIRDTPLSSLYFLEVVILGPWFQWGFVYCSTLTYRRIQFQDSLQFFQCYRVRVVECAEMRIPTWKFAKFCSVLLCTVHNSCPLRAFPHSSRCAFGKDLNITDHFMYYRSCFSALVRYGMAFRFQRR